MSTEVSNVVVADEPMELQLVAHSREQMAAAQTKLIDWAQRKIDEQKLESEEASKAKTVALAAGFDTGPFHRSHLKAVRLIDFYEKLKAAFSAGYVLIPDFPVDVFAIRTNKRYPAAQESRYRNDTRNQSSEGPSLGEGEYVDSDPTICKGSTYHEENHKKELVPVQFWKADEFKDVIDFPMSIAKAAVMDDVACAMQQKIFDEIGVLPNRRQIKKDPIVVGIIRDPRSSTYNKRRVMFLLAWYLDTRTL